jgi:endogenous inhibitor of DNA gyrase (YacG/DUF329 family)
MGMFDSVIVRCPKCGTEVEFQSKAGECRLNNYAPESAPPAVLVDTVGQTATCPTCATKVESVLMGPVPVAFVARGDDG